MSRSSHCCPPPLSTVHCVSLRDLLSPMRIWKEPKNRWKIDAHFSNACLFSTPHGTHHRIWFSLALTVGLSSVLYGAAYTHTQPRGSNSRKMSLHELGESGWIRVGLDESALVLESLSGAGWVWASLCESQYVCASLWEFETVWMRLSCLLIYRSSRRLTQTDLPWVLDLIPLAPNRGAPAECKANKNEHSRCDRAVNNNNESYNKDISDEFA